MNTSALRDTWLMFQREHNCSVDRMLCHPELRAEFLSTARQATGGHAEREILWALVGLRKKKTLPAVLK